MAYIYRHIRLDKNVPFYIGISEKDIYRATITRCRNRILNTHMDMFGDIKIKQIDELKARLD